MSFLKFFFKDIKADKTFNWFYVLCSVLGIIGLLLVESFRVGVEDKVASNAKNFIAGDLSVSSRRTIEEAERADIEEYLRNQKFEYAEWIETYSLISKIVDSETSEIANTKLAALNFVTEEFPFYGGVTLDPKEVKGPGDWGNLHETPQLWISRDLSWELDVQVGDVLKVGELNFEVGGIIVDDQFSSFRGFSLAPKVFLSKNYLEQTELIKFGSTATYSYSIQLPPKAQLKKIKEDLRKVIPEKSIRIREPAEANQQVSRSLNLLTDYLGLITLMTYLLSLVGLYYFTQHFLSKKLKTFSIYKAMGVTTKFLFKVSFVQLAVLTFIAVVISSAIVGISLPFIQSYFTKLVGEELFFRLSFVSMLRILSLSMGGSLLALGPLFWGAMQTPVAIVFQDLPAELKRLKIYYFIPLLLYVVALAVLLSNSFKVGGLFLAGLGVIIFLAGILFKIFTVLLDKFSANFSFVNRHAAKTLSRYFSSSFTIFICLLVGMTLTTFIFQLESSLRSEFTQTHGDRRPDLFIFDLQDSQEDLFNKLTESNNWNRTMMSPIIRARMLKINDEPTQTRNEPGENDNGFQTREDEQSEQFRNRGVNLSYRSELSWSETLVKGKFNGSPCNPDAEICEISLEESYARRVGAKMGDKLVFEISGVEIEGVVTSLRKVKWTSFEPNFFILFQPGVIEEAPKTFLSSIKAESFEEKKKIFSTLAQTFPTVSILEVSEIIKKVTRVFDLMAIAIKFISFLSLFVALIVLVAVSFNHLELRKREMTLFSMLGLKKESILKIYSREFSFLILMCTFLSIFFGTVLTTIIMTKGFATDAVLRFEFVLPAMFAIGLALYLVVKSRVKKLLKTKSLF